MAYYSFEVTLTELQIRSFGKISPNMYGIKAQLVPGILVKGMSRFALISNRILQKGIRILKEVVCFLVCSRRLNISAFLKACALPIR